MTDSPSPATALPSRAQSAADRTAVLALIPTAVAFNMAIATVVRILHPPIYLDCIGPITVSLLAGFWPGVVVSVLCQVGSVLLGSPADYLYYTGTVVAVGAAAYLCGILGGFRGWWRIVLSGLLIGVVSAAASAPITYWKGGMTSAGSTFVTTFFLLDKKSLLASVIYSGITCDLPDKIIEAFIAVWLIRSIPIDLLRRFHGPAIVKNFSPTEPPKS